MNDYNIDDLHFSLNDIHEQWDNGKIHHDDAVNLLVKCCKAFIQFNETPQREQNQAVDHSIQFEKATDCFLWLEENEIYNPVTLTIHLEN
jgi:hypothetical protein